jgi:hypothetical protein
MDYADMKDIKCSLAKLIAFVQKYQWVYNIKVTHLFKTKIWDRIPIDWYEFLSSLSEEELSSLPDWSPTHPSCPAHCPGTLLEYILNCQKLSIGREQLNERNMVEEDVSSVWKEISRGMNPKKLHEVSRMAKYVNEVCTKVKCRTVVDVGSGLGYLGQCLSAKYGLQVVGLEREEGRVESAARRTGKIARSQERHKKTMSASSQSCLVEEDQQKDQDVVKCCSKDDLEKEKVLKYANESGLQEVNKDDLQKVNKDGLQKVNKGGLQEVNKGHLHAKQEVTCVSVTEGVGTDRVLPSVCGLASSHASSCKGSYCDFENIRDSLVGRFHGNGPCPTSSFVTLPVNVGDSEDSFRQFEALVNDICSEVNERVCLVGLHCCGDLTPTLMRWTALSQLARVRAIVLVGCCYHKMVAVEGKKDTLTNFPMSDFVKKYIETEGLAINAFALRLAAQETKRRCVSTNHSTVSWRLLDWSYCTHTI